MAANRDLMASAAIDQNGAAPRNDNPNASGLIYSDDSQIDRSGLGSRHESRNYRKGHPGGPPSTGMSDILCKGPL